MPELSDFVPEIICMGIDLIICGALYKGYSSANKYINDLTSAPQISIDDHLRSHIENHPRAQVAEDGESVVLPFAVVRGDVAPLGKAVSSSYATQMVTGAIQRVVFMEHKRNLSRTGFWFDSERVLHQFTNDAPFCLTSPQESIFTLIRPHVEVMEWKEASRIDLDTVYDQFEPAVTGLSSHLWGWVTGDMQKGVQKTEMMLTKGTTLTGVGELVSTQYGVKLQPPSDGRSYYLVKDSLKSLIKELEGGRSALKIFLWVFGSVGAFLFAMTSYRYYTRYLLEKTAANNQENLETIRAERLRRNAERSDEIPEHAQCVVCLGAEREVILLNCGHVCVCADCAGEIIRNGHNCPVCRSAIERIMPAYIS